MNIQYIKHYPYAGNSFLVLVLIDNKYRFLHRYFTAVHVYHLNRPYAHDSEYTNIIDFCPFMKNIK